tara:strand:+ start:22877 stop:23497 length:621 start_codon:yes stop_codon:yes gene_type:complete
MKVLKILLPSLFILWLLTLGIHFHHEERHNKFIFNSVSNSAVELKPAVYAHEFNYKDHEFFYGIPFVLSYSGVIQPLPGSLRLKFHTSDNLIGAKVYVENVYVRYHKSSNHEKTKCEKPASNSSVKEETFNPGYTEAITRVTYEADIRVLNCIFKREDFDLTTEGYILHGDEKIIFEFTNQARYLNSGITWVPGWPLLYVAVTGGA